MANYPTHLTGGVLIGAAASLAAAALGMISAAEMPFVAMVGTWGGLAPDLDSDGSRPTQLMFAYATVVVPSVLLWRLPVLHDTLPRALAAWIIIAAIVRGPLFLLFRKLTKHRGIFHSIPAALIFGGLGFLWSGRVNDVDLQIATGASAAAGYLTHLVLDEVYSVDFEGRRIKRSFGTALALWAPSWGATALAYGLLGLVGLLTWEGLGGRRPEGIWADSFGDAPLLWLESAMVWLEGALTGWLE